MSTFSMYKNASMDKVKSKGLTIIEEVNENKNRDRTPIPESVVIKDKPENNLKKGLKMKKLDRKKYAI